MRLRGAMPVACLVLLFGACRTTSQSPYAKPSEASRNTAAAERLSREGAELVYSDPEEAERLMREALVADVFFGPAHNNLGVLYLEQGRLYDAANEFEWARKLMPGHPDPRMNLALTLEKAGRVDEAEETYRAALEVYPGHVPSQQALARLLVQERAPLEETLPLLRSVSLEGENQRWREWARLQIAKQERGVDTER